MLHQVSSARCRNLLRLWVLPDDLLHHGVMHRRHVCLDMCIVILIHECLHRLAHHNEHVLADRIDRLHVVLHRDKFVCVLDPEGLNHLPVKKRQIVDLRRALSEL